MQKHPKSKIFSNAGVGRKYHLMSLTEYPNTSAAKVLDWINNPSENLLVGKGILFFGETSSSYDLTLLTVRAIILSGRENIKCFSFYDAIQKENINTIWQDKPILVITNFFPDKVYYSPQEYKALENVINYYIDNNLTIILHIPFLEYETIDSSHQVFNPVVFDLISKTNTIIKVS